MKRLFLSVTAAILAVAPAPASARQPIEGRWKNGDMEIVIASCGPNLCGRVVKASEHQREKAQRGSGTHLLGARVIDNIEPAGPGAWRADVFLAGRNMNARGTIEQVGPDRLAVHGCLLAVICRTTHWDRVS